MKERKKMQRMTVIIIGQAIYKMIALLELYMVLQLQLVCVSKACLDQFFRNEQH